MARVPVRLGSKRRSSIQRPWPTTYQIMPAWARAGAVWAIRVRMSWTLLLLAERGWSLSTSLEVSWPAAGEWSADANEWALVMPPA